VAEVTFQGDLYGASFHEDVPRTLLVPPYAELPSRHLHASGGNLLGRWTRTFREESSLMLQAYYDRTHRDDPGIGERRDIFDVEFQHALALGARQDLVWGAGYRYTEAHFQDSLFLDVLEEADRRDLYSLFVQDETKLVENRLHLTLGSKFEVNEYTGLEIQPSARLSWTPHERVAVWGAVSRAVRTPTFNETSVRVNPAAFDPDGPQNPAPTSLISVLPNADLRAESVIAYEVGCRLRPADPFYVDVASFVNVYDRLAMLAPGAPFAEIEPLPPHLVLP
jgi:iron complex outermembrane receptor protein